VCGAGIANANLENLASLKDSTMPVGQGLNSFG
jgi:hypothetical protein